LTVSRDDGTIAPARRVLAFTPTFAPGYKAGGPIKSMLQILENLPDSVEVTLVTADRDLGDSVAYPGLSGKVVHRGSHEVYYLNWRNPRHWMNVMHWARLNPVDLIYVNSLWSPHFTVLPVMAHRLGLLPSREVLLAPRGELSVGALGIKSTKKQVFLRGWAPLLRRMDPVWHASTEMEQTDIHRLFPTARTVIQTASQGDEPREEIIRSRERARFVFISRITEMKNLILALQALQTVKAEADFDIYGPVEDVQYWRQCQRLIADLPWNVEGRYLGELRPSQVTDTFAQYDAFVLPTRGENFGHVIAESLSAGCPVICSQRTPWTEVLRQGGGAVLDQLDARTLSEEIEAWANRTPSQRDTAKRSALKAYVEWRNQQERTSAVERALDGVPRIGQTDDCAKSPRIALVTQGYQSAGGVQTVSRWLALGLRDAGYEVSVFDLASSRTDAYSRRLMSPSSWRRPTLLKADPSEVQVTHVGANGVEFEPLRYLPRAELSSELSRYDLVQVVAGGPSVALAAMNCRRPIVLQVATTVAWERASQLATTGWALGLWRGAMTKTTSRMELRALRQADAVLVENDRMRDFVHSVSQARVFLAPPGVDTEHFTPRKEAWDSRGYLLSVCRLNDARKGLDRLIRSYALITTQRPSAPQLVLAGRGDLPAHLQQLIADLGLAECVSVRSDVPQAELPALYRGASVYLQTSHEEGLGISILEAMASGLPVVSTETAGTLETVAHGETGWLISQESDVEVELAARTLSVIDVDGHVMSVSARSRADSLFSERVTLSRFLEVYDELIGCHGASARNR
jgi:glycosyltransferase involved in cell wall biosynthesis